MWLLTKRRHSDAWESGHVPRFHLDEEELAASGVAARACPTVYCGEAGRFFEDSRASERWLVHLDARAAYG